MSQWGEYLNVNVEGHLELEGWDVSTLAETHGTPLFIYSEATLRSNYQRVYSAFHKYHSQTFINCSVKANISPALLKILQTEGAGADVDSRGELYATLLAGMDGTRLTCNGPNKSEVFLTDAVTAGCLICVDNHDELARLDALTRRLQRRSRILFRAKPLSDELPEATYQHVKDSKFGMPFDIAYQAAHDVQSLPYLDPVGLHFHIGTQLLGQEKAVATAATLQFAARLKHELGINTAYLALGGGLPVTRPYGYGMGYGTDRWAEVLPQPDRVPSLDTQARATIDVVHATSEKHGLTRPTLIIEPGATPPRDGGAACRPRRDYQDGA